MNVLNSPRNFSIKYHKTSKNLHEGLESPRKVNSQWRKVYSWRPRTKDEDFIWRPQFFV